MLCCIALKRKVHAQMFHLFFFLVWHLKKNHSDTFKEQSHRHFFIQFEGTGNINESQTNEDEMWDSNENSGTNALLSKIL
jgi:hypothetical protein